MDSHTKQAYRNNGLGAWPPIVVFDYQTSRSGLALQGLDFLSGV